MVAWYQPGTAVTYLEKLRQIDRAAWNATRVSRKRKQLAARPRASVMRGIVRMANSSASAPCRWGPALGILLDPDVAEYQQRPGQHRLNHVANRVDRECDTPDPMIVPPFWEPKKLTPVDHFQVFGGVPGASRKSHPGAPG